MESGSWLGDAVEEYKAMPTWGKVVTAGIGIGVVLYALHVYQTKGSSSTSSGVSVGSTQSGTQSPYPMVSDGSTQSGTQSPYPMVSDGSTSVPILPSTVSPVYNPSNGDLTAYQQTSTSTTPASTSSTNYATQGYYGLLGANANVNIQNSTYMNSSGQSVPIPIASGDKLVQGSQGRVWYTDGGGQHLLTSGSGPAIDPTTNTPVTASTGGGGESWQSYHRSLRPKLTHYTVQHGDNMNEVANKLGMNSWKDFGVNTFKAGDRLPIRGKS
jgi:hypothetical protein